MAEQPADTGADASGSLATELRAPTGDNPPENPNGVGWRDPQTNFYYNHNMAYQNWPKGGVLGAFRMAWRVLAMFAVLLTCLPLYFIWRILRISNPWPRLFLRGIARCCGAKVSSRGTALRRDVFFISNHLSWIDIPIIAGRNGSAFVAQDGIAAWPFIGWLCTLNNTVFVQRTDRMGIAKQINNVRDALTEAWAITIFPEGTTTDGKTMLPFKSPLLKVLDPPPPGVLAQPIYIDFGPDGRDLCWIGDEEALGNAWRVLSRRGNFKVKVHFLDPFDPTEYGGRKAVAAEARRRIAERMTQTLGYKVE